MVLHIDFWSLVDTRGSWDVCWVWLHNFDDRGRPVFHHEKAYRVAFKRRFGVIPDGKEIHHLCLNNWCVNPRHLVAINHSTHTLLVHDMKMIQAVTLAKWERAVMKRLTSNN